MSSPISVFKRALTRENEADEGIKTMKATLLEAVNRRFRDVESEPLYSIAKLLDIKTGMQSPC